MYIEVRQPNSGKLLFRFDPIRDLVEIAERGNITVVDLQQYRKPTERPERLSDRQERPEDRMTHVASNIA